MRAYGLRLPAVLATMAAVLALLFAGQFLYARQAVAMPLASRLRAVAGVRAAPVVTSTAQRLQIAVPLDEVADLRATYGQLLAAADKSAGARQLVIEVEDNPTAALTSDYFNTLNPIIAQGRATGQYVAMQEQISAAARILGISATVTVGDSQIFVSLISGDHYLYHIVPLTMTSGTGGSDAS